MSWLERILESKRIEVEKARARNDLPSERPRRVIDPCAALLRAQGERLRLIAEIKLRSPSAGALSRKLGIAARAAIYRNSGAKMVSVLVDGPHFDGSYTHLAEAAAALKDTPVLAKEYVLDEVQVERAHAFGADAVLVIARILDDAALRQIMAACDRVGLTALVEVFTPEELTRALAVDARIIGVNARDLDTLEMNAPRARAILEAIPRDVIALHLSGVKTEADVADLAKSRADGALLGEALMREDDPTSVLAHLVAAT